MPFCAQAARTVLRSRQAMVMGPTPPGTGVIEPATFSQDCEIAIANQLALAVALDAVDAHIDDAGAGLQPVALHHFGAAHRGDNQIGAAHHRRAGLWFWNARW